MNVLNRRISKLKARMGLSAEEKAQAERWRSAAENLGGAAELYDKGRIGLRRTEVCNFK